MRRYNRVTTVKGGKQYGTSRACNSIYHATRNGTIASYKRVTLEGERLDILAGKIYGDASLWWVIAAASGMGWGLQVPPNSVLIIPSNLEEIALYVG